MKKQFITPQVSVVRYDTDILCTSAGFGKDIEEGESVEFDAPRRQGIFDNPLQDERQGL